MSFDGSIAAPNVIIAQKIERKIIITDKTFHPARAIVMPDLGYMDRCTEIGILLRLPPEQQCVRISLDRLFCYLAISQSNQEQARWHAWRRPMFALIAE